MNQIGTYNPNDVHHSNMATTHAHPPSSGPMGGHYSQYPAPIMPSQHPYTTQYQSYGAYPAYSGAPVSSSMSHHSLVAMQPAPSQATLPGTQNYMGHQMDTTGQLAPPGVKPRVTATLWEDEGTLCFQVEAKGVCVARREDNHMINGTKLLNVAGMTRGRRDGILKSEKLRHVVKIGPMHLKGVWIPFERALDFANKEKITENLYPLFVHDIGALLYHPQNSSAQRPGAGMGSTQSALAAYERRRTEQRMGAMPPQTPSQAPAMHPMVGPVPNGQAPARPGMDRASTFPTPPTSASSVALNPQGSPYEYSMPSQSQQLSIDTTISNQRSVPNTPASTPPGKATHGSAVYSNSQSYDPARPVYSNATPSGQYQRQVQFGGPLQPPPSYKKEEEHDHQEYHSSNGYVPSQSAYSYNPNSASAGQPSPQQNGSGRVTPRTSTSQIYQYPTPQRSNTAPASNVYNVMEPRDAANGHESHYYPAPTNGAGTKRGREDDDEVEDSKRQKVDPEDGGPVGGSPYPSINAGRPVIAARKAR